SRDPVREDVAGAIERIAVLPHLAAQSRYRRCHTGAQVALARSPHPAAAHHELTGIKEAVLLVGELEKADAQARGDGDCVAQKRTRQKQVDAAGGGVELLLVLGLELARIAEERQPERVIAVLQHAAEGEQRLKVVLSLADDAVVVDVVPRSRAERIE